MHRQRSAAKLRVTTLVVFVLFLVGSIASSLHMALVRHAVCPEHGEVVHVAPTPDAPVCASAAHDHHDVRWAALPASSDDAGHDHCPVATQARVRDVAWTPVRVVVQKDGAPLARACAPASPRVPAFARFYLAPKHSPPV
jgi:hypothetical protein